MAERVIVIDKSIQKYLTWLRTSYASLGIKNKEGIPLVSEIEMNSDRDEIFDSFFDEAALQVLLVISSRQDGVSSPAYLLDNISVSFKYIEREPVLANSESIRISLEESIKYAIYYYIAFMWFTFLGYSQGELFFIKFKEHLDKIAVFLYKLHD